MKGTRIYTKHKCNTDSLCYDDSSMFAIIRKLKLWQYWYNLWTGMYILDAPERFVVNLILGCAMLSLGYGTISFGLGFVNGVLNGDNSDML
mmetsp:Transcript_16632/g.21637  ORF Transcript_16632/g.21637 Transcript_16632/m.21637 type:complete len:91 (+) Transcript_16632:80-352(+)